MMNHPLFQEAIHHFKKLFRQVRTRSLGDPTAMTLSTSTGEGRPSSRTVLLKGVDESGFVFYTNLNSRKGKELAANPRASLCFYWPGLHRQALVEGIVKPVSDKEADAYWATRPRLSQIGAWASKQSEPLINYAQLLGRAAKFKTKFSGKPVPRPPHWTGFCLIPHRIEFWRARPYRLHERIEYKKVGNRWLKGWLYP